MLSATGAKRERVNHRYVRTPVHLCIFSIEKVQCAQFSDWQSRIGTSGEIRVMFFSKSSPMIGVSGCVQTRVSRTLVEGKAQLKSREWVLDKSCW